MWRQLKVNLSLQNYEMAIVNLLLKIPIEGCYADLLDSVLSVSFSKKNLNSLTKYSFWVSDSDY